MADIAAVFHWPLAELERLALPDLVDWQQLAIDRFRSMNRNQGE